MSNIFKVCLMDTNAKSSNKFYRMVCIFGTWFWTADMIFKSNSRSKYLNFVYHHFQILNGGCLLFVVESKGFGLLV